MGNQAVFVVNCGSSSVKFQMVEPLTGKVLLKGRAENLQTERAQLFWEKEQRALSKSGYLSVLQEIAHRMRPFENDLLGIGHRVVHGGELFQESVLIDTNVLDQIDQCTPLAPLHNPVNLQGIKIFSEAFPHLPQVAVFDTAFHQTLPDYAYLFGLPYEYYEKHQVRRYGFHGTSHRFVTKEAAKQLNVPLESLALISMHLGNGCSVCAVLGGKSLDTSMGITPMGGVMMGQRCGDLDPSLVGFLEKKLSLKTEEVMDILNKKSGLLGVSGVSEDVREIEKAANEGNRRAKISLEIFCYQVAKMVASYIVPLKRVDALIFTGGIGENSVFVRQRVCEWLTGIGVEIDPSQNVTGKRGVISPVDKDPKVLVVPTNEEWVIAQDVKGIVDA